MGAIGNSLNEQQYAAVTADTVHAVLVLAGAGTGKTTVLTHRIAFIVRNETPPETLLALTFTKKASLEMAARVKRRMLDDGYNRTPLITTFHGLCYRAMSQYVDGVPNYARAGWKTMPVLLDETKNLAHIAEYTSAEERRALGTDLSGLDSLLEKLSLNPAKLDYLGPGTRKLLEEIWARLLHQRRQQGVWIFSDMTRSFVDILRGHDTVREHYRGTYKVILVDEFQDTNPLQIVLLKELLAPATHLFAVGDDDQAIYGFRGADSAPTLQFGTMFPGASIFKLEINYRSTPRILLAANMIFRNKPEAYRKVLRAPLSGDGRRKDPPIRRRRFLDQKEMSGWICATASKLALQMNIRESDMAALFRLNESRLLIENHFKESFKHVHVPQCLTVHASKGLEFPVVFFCDLEESILPNYRLPKGRRGWWRQIKDRIRGPDVPLDCDLDEERRLFYVGLTRAREQLFLLCVARRQVRGVTRSVLASRFLRSVH